MLELSEEMKKYARKSALEYQEKLNFKQMLTKKILFDFNYINWLVDFSRTHNSFYDDDWVYTPEAITEEDSMQLRKLGNFFGGIVEYVYKMNLVLDEDYYLIKFEDKMLTLREFHGQGVHIQVNRVEENVEGKVIDIRDVVEYYSEGNDLSQVSFAIKNAFSKGIPEEAIIEKVSKTLEQLNAEQQKRMLFNLD